jgi:uncharacterized Ntn-hydrolase superfamily protein
MTWSIVARDSGSDAVGIAIASKFFAVGAVCPYMRAGAGVMSSQSLVNPYLGVWGIRLLEGGTPAPATIEALVAADPGRATRQLHAVDWHGRTGAYTGTDCVPWAGHRVDEGVSVAGNMLTSAAVVEDTLATYLEHEDKPFAERLLRAMDAGERAGGDKRGRQGAALRIVGTEEYPDLDLRVDDHTDPVAELWRLYEVAHDRFLARRELMPTRADPVGIHRFEELEPELERRLAERVRPDFSDFWKNPVRPRAR